MVDPRTDTYNFTGGWQRFDVPRLTRTIEIVVHGAGAGSGGTAQQGGRVRGKLDVTGQDVLYILVGEQGHTPSGANGGNQTTGGGGAGGNGGSPGRVGGGSGGGASEVRLNSTDGKLIAMAGGAGGPSGDGGKGGGGGGNNGGDGHRGSGPDANVATGGTQTKGGNGGTTGVADFNGGNASDNVSGRGGLGGHSNYDRSDGGGGGGGGYHAGGGGQARKQGAFSGGGGGGGSNYIDGLKKVDVNDRDGEFGHGVVTLTYDPDGDPNPITPTNVRINGRDAGDEIPLHGSTVTITAHVEDVTGGGSIVVTPEDVHEYVLLAPGYDPGPPQGDPRVGFRITQRGTGAEAIGGTSTVTIGGLDPNTLWHGRVYTQDLRGQFSNSYVPFSVWTNRRPNPPGIVTPYADTEINSDDTFTFEWTYSDPDVEPGYPETQSDYQLAYRLAATPTAQPGPWQFVQEHTANHFRSALGASFVPGRWYEWMVQVADGQLWSDWSPVSNFYIHAVAQPPTLLEPIGNEAIYAAENNVFVWRFNTLLNDETQVTADIRYRAVGGDDSDWETIEGDLDAPGSGVRWLIDAETFVEGTWYEWQARVHTSNSTVSVWSASAYFWAVALPSFQPDIIPIDVTRMQEALGTYDNEVHIYRRGGKIPVGRIKPIADITWSRQRDDIGSCVFHVTEWDPETRDLLRTLKPWAHEVVVFRNGVRCWEGPITRVSGNTLNLEVEAQDVMVYVKRRILRNGYNDSYQCLATDVFGNCIHQLGLHTVVYRAQRIITNALVYDDPNVLPYLTPIHNPGDAIQSRVVKAFTRTAWEEVDDLAAKAGLDYSVAGRRIILNDTHRPIGRIPELSDGDFSDPPIVTVYGMSFATDFGVTNNNGYYGLAQRHDATLGETGWVEMLASQYGESEVPPAGTESLTPEEVAALQATLQAQAERNIASRFPMPVIVRVPDNSTLNPQINLGINQLIPGVWAPLRATEGLLQAAQWQKLDTLTVSQDSNGEKIQVVFSPAPNGGVDPDADLGEE